MQTFYEEPERQTFNSPRHFDTVTPGHLKYVNSDVSESQHLATTLTIIKLFYNQGI